MDGSQYLSLYYSRSMTHSSNPSTTTKTPAATVYFHFITSCDCLYLSTSGFISYFSPLVFHLQREDLIEECFMRAISWRLDDSLGTLAQYI